MKRHGQLMDAIADPANLRLAFWKAAKSKRAKTDCRAFQEKLDDNLATLRAELLSGRVVIGDYRSFTIYDPKERIICAASFRERVLHHALMNVCEPVLERAAILDSYACRKGMGAQAAVRRASSYARQHGWFLKMDIRKYFDSIDQDVLRGLLRRKFKDAGVLELFDRILASYQTAPGRGLPIGNLTSQHFANFYLAPLDRFIKEYLQRPCYVRYMDDFVVWGETAAELREVWLKVEAFLATELHLELKPNVMLNRTERGMDFLGYRLFPHDLRLARRSKRRFVRKFRAYERQGVDGTPLAATHDGLDRLHAAEPKPGVPAQRNGTIWGGGQRAPTACSAAAVGTTTPTTRGAPTGTTTTRPTPTTTLTFGLCCPQLNPWVGRPAD